MNLDTLLNAYIEETGFPVTVAELKETLKLFPIIYNRDLIGIFGYQSSSRDKLGRIAIITLLYVLPSQRKNIRWIVQYITTYLLSCGYRHCEVWASKRISRYFTHRYKSSPELFVHFFKLEDIVNHEYK